MYNDQVLSRLTDLGKTQTDDLFKVTLLHVFESIYISLRGSNKAAIGFLREKYPYIGSLSAEAEEIRKESILTGAWLGRNDTICADLSLNEEQREAVLTCFADSKYLGSYNAKETSKYPMVSKYYESDLLRFRLGLTEQTLVTWHLLNNSPTFEEEIKDSEQQYKQIGITMVKMAD